MSFNRYADIRIQPVVPEFTIQETTMVPLMKQKRRDDMWDKLSQMDTDVNRTSQDDPFIKQDIEGFTGRRGEIVNRMTENPFDPTLSKDLYTLGADIKTWKTTGRGFHSQQAYNKFSTAKPTYLEQGLKAGHSLEETEANWAIIEKELKESGKWGAFNPETGEGLDYQTALIYDIPKGEEQHEYLQKVFKNVSGYLLNESGASRVKNNNGVLEIVDYSDLSSHNREALQAAVDAVNIDVGNKGSTISKSMAFKKQDPETLLNLAASYATMASKSEERHKSKTHYTDLSRSADEDTTVAQRAETRVEYGTQENPLNPNDPAIVDLPPEKQVEMYMDTFRLTEEQREKIRNATGEGSIWRKLGSDLGSLKDLINIAYVWSEEDGQISKTQKALQISQSLDNISERAINSLSDEEQTRLLKSIGVNPGNKTFHEIKQEFAQQANSDMEINELENVIDNLHTYYNTGDYGYSKDQLRRMYKTNRSGFNKLILDEMANKAVITNGTYKDWSSSPTPEDERSKKAAQDKFNWDSLNDIPIFYTKGGTPIKRTSLIPEGALEEDYKITVTGWANAGNPTDYARSYRLSIRDKDGNTQTVYAPDNVLVTPQESVIHKSHKGIVTSPRNYGTINELLQFTAAPDTDNLKWERTSKGYRFYLEHQDGTRDWVENSSGEVEYYSDPMSFLDTFAK